MKQRTRNQKGRKGKRIEGRRKKEEEEGGVSARGCLLYGRNLVFREKKQLMYGECRSIEGGGDQEVLKQLPRR